MMVPPINITIEDTTFVSNRGRSGGAINIYSYNSLNIQLHNLTFLNNSVIQSYVNSSAIYVLLNTPSPASMMAILNMSFCNFTNNSGGRNVIGLIIAGQPVRWIIIKNSSFVGNKLYEVGLVEISVWSQSIADLEYLDFHNNNGSALLYSRLHSANFSISLHNINATGNNGTTTLSRGGLLVFQVRENNIDINITSLTYENNRFGRRGGGIYIIGTFRRNVTFNLMDSNFQNNTGKGSGIVLYSSLISDRTYYILICNNSFTNNVGSEWIVYIAKQSLMESALDSPQPAILLLGHSTQFSNNTGGALSLSNVILIGVGNTTFEHNMARDGAGLHLSDSFILSLTDLDFQFHFTDNYAFAHGGAMYIDLSNADSGYHWLLRKDRCYPHCDVYESQLVNELQLVNESGSCKFIFQHNNALAAGSDIFYQAPEWCVVENTSDPNSTLHIPSKMFCFNNSIHSISTQPFQLRLTEAQCNDMNCTTSIMLGKELNISADVVDCNNKSAESTVFFVECIENCTTSNGSTNYMITGNIPILVSDKIEGIKITGIQNGPPLKLQLMSTTITLNLVIELIPCQSGYTYNNETKQCKCYTTDGIVSCKPELTIKRGYWFGMVDNTTTVSRCPYTYCNFSHGEVSSGSFVLPSVQDDQCDSHRTGPACGSCDDGYTIPFDSDKCISVDDCHPGYTVLVIIGVMVYWVIVIVTTFALMLWLHRIKCTVGYLYGIIYYYSVVDILLGQVVSRSDELSSLVSIFGGTIFKLYPGFLFRVCFVQGFSAIDQYVIHYTHPTSILVLVWLLSKLARRSVHFTTLISKAAIPTICLILMLAYISIADTSLQLLKYMQFTDVNTVYSWLSPSMGYFSGRHIIYFMIAVLYELVIGIGLPLLLLLEPFVNHKINFTGINLYFTKLNLKPLLDQFQGCYKDKFRWFASVYLIGGQMILIITVIDFTNAYIKQYLLMIVCVIISLLHYTLQPYKSNTLNRYDGIILHSLLLIVSLHTIALCNGLATEAITGIAYTMYFFPILVSLIFTSLYIYASVCISSRDMVFEDRLCRVDISAPTSFNFRSSRRRNHRGYAHYQESLLNYVD
ncbi:uncharacterized protein [Dysidea avara]|uniref:uncharacterized protein isoform X1 n=2 Tax=Dysidea avara TaxID=196820 RepID=UPI00331C5308